MLLDARILAGRSGSQKLEAVVYRESTTGRLVATLHNDGSIWGAERWIIVPKSHFRGAYRANVLESLTEQSVYERCISPSSKSDFSANGYSNGTNQTLVSGSAALEVRNILKGVTHLNLLQPECPF